MAEYQSEFKVPDGKAYCFQVKERKSEYAPEFKGNMVLTRDYKAGETIKLAVWAQTTKTGKPWIKIAEETDAWKNQDGRPTQYPKEVNNIDDNEVPF